jgi:hypothetical protein
LYPSCVSIARIFNSYQFKTNREKEIPVNNQKNYLILSFMTTAICLSMIGCSIFQNATIGEERTESQSIEAGGAETAQVLIEMEAGELMVEGGADQLMVANFRYNVDEFEPQVEYTVTGSQGELVVDQPDSQNLINRNMINEWTIQLNNQIPLDVEIRTGAGNNTIDLSALDLSSLIVEVGAGNTNVNLNGNQDHDVTATLNGGVGNLTVQLPSEMGVRINANAGLGGVTAPGLTQEGSGYVNEAFGTAPYTLILNVNTGVGAIEFLTP